jgi:hypothetical protein
LPPVSWKSRLRAPDLDPLDAPTAVPYIDDQVGEVTPRPVIDSASTEEVLGETQAPVVEVPASAPPEGPSTTTQLPVPTDQEVAPRAAAAADKVREPMVPDRPVRRPRRRSATRPRPGPPPAATTADNTGEDVRPVEGLDVEVSSSTDAR